jgi:hypothetical protein
VSDDTSPFNLEGLRQSMDTDGCVFHVQAIFRNTGITNARQIRCNHGKLPAKSGMIGLHMREVWV